MNVTLVDRGRAGQRQGCEQKRMPQKALLPKKGLMACWHPEKLFSGALTHKCSWCPGVFLAMHSISWLLLGYAGPSVLPSHRAAGVLTHPTLSPTKLTLWEVPGGMFRITSTLACYRVLQTEGLTQQKCVFS